MWPRARLTLGTARDAHLIAQHAVVPRVCRRLETTGSGWCYLVRPSTGYHCCPQLREEQMWRVVMEGVGTDIIMYISNKNMRQRRQDTRV